MANTYSQLYIHIVFAVRNRMPLIADSWKVELYKYIAAIIERRNQKLYIINGVQDHIHILVSISPDCSISNLVRDIKANSTQWINENQKSTSKFQWQLGFGAFSCSQSYLKKAIRYIEFQEHHHARISFEKEYLKLLKLHQVEFDEKWVF
jgi:REP element-mobilizing transposase RayT